MVATEPVYYGQSLYEGGFGFTTVKLKHLAPWHPIWGRPFIIIQSILQVSFGYIYIYIYIYNIYIYIYNIPDTTIVRHIHKHMYIYLCIYIYIFIARPTIVLPWQPWHVENPAFRNGLRTPWRGWSFSRGSCWSTWEPPCLGAGRRAQGKQWETNKDGCQLASSCLCVCTLIYTYMIANELSMFLFVCAFHFFIETKTGWLDDVRRSGEDYPAVEACQSPVRIGIRGQDPTMSNCPRSEILNFPAQ